MKTRSLGLLTLLLLPFAPACDEQDADPEPVTIANKSAEEAADLTTDAACDYISRCGYVEESCPACVDGEECGECTVEHVPVSHEECAEELGPELAMGFSCDALTAEEQALVDECLAALPTAECPSIETVHDGEESSEPPAELGACDVLDEIMSRCYEEGSQSEPRPG